MSSDEIVIEVMNLSKRYEIYATPRDRLKQLIFPTLHRLLSRVGISRGKLGNTPPQFFREFWALHGVSFHVKKGETLGIVGRNGSGKSTLLQLICSTLTPTSGDLITKGRISALLELGSGFNPDYTGRENVFLNGQLLGLSKEEIESRFDSIVEFADIDIFIDQPIKTYSSGMVVRLAFAVAVSVNPSILVIDEALAVGDIVFQRKCMAWMERFTNAGGTLLFVSHSTEQVRRLCNKAVYLKHGQLVAFDTAKHICDMYESEMQSAEALAVNAGSPCVAVDSHKQKHLIFQNDFQFPECAVQYAVNGAEIMAAWTEGNDGVVRNKFEEGEEIVWCYQVVFKRDVQSVIFGLMLKTKEGINIYSTNTSLLNEALPSFMAGDIVMIRFDIDSHLGGGDYFLNCGVSIEDALSGFTFLHRVVDAAAISVSTRNNGSGLIDMDISFSYDKLVVPIAKKVSEVDI